MRFQEETIKSLLWLMFVCAALAAPGAPDPVENLKVFSGIQRLDPSRMMEGEILGERGSMMEFPQGIFAQTCFVVPLSAAEAARRLQVWDPSRHQMPSVLVFTPVRIPCERGDFQRLDLKPSNRAMSWLLERSPKASLRQSELNLTQGEARHLADNAKANPDPQAVSACWGGLLLARATAFQHQGFAGVPPYETSGKPVSPTEHLRAMLREKSAVEREFAPLLEQCGLRGGEATVTLIPFHYWAVYEANRRATLSLGAVYLLALDDRHQLLDAQYYVSGTYYTSVTLYQVWPIRVGERTGAMIWRGDFFSAPTLAFMKGTERLAYGALMMQEIKKTIRCFQDDVKGRP